MLRRAFYRLDIEQAALADAVRSVLGQNALRDLCELRAERKEQERRRDVENRVHGGDLRGRACGQKGFHKAGQRRKHADEREQHGAEHVKEQVDDGRALCIAVGADGGEHCRDAGADILAEQDINRAGQADQPAGRQRLQDADGGRGRLNDRREKHADENAEQRVRHFGHQIDEKRGFAQRRHGVAHHAHAEKQDAEAGDDLPPVAQDGFFQKHNESDANESEERRKRAHIQRDQKAGHCGADVCAHDDPHGLPQRHHAGIYEADDHDGRGGGGLDCRRDTGADQNAEKAVGGELFKNALHAVARRSLQTRAHHLHAVEKQGQAAEQPENIADLHEISFSFPVRAGRKPVKKKPAWPGLLLKVGLSRFIFLWRCAQPRFAPFSSSFTIPAILLYFYFT